MFEVISNNKCNKYIYISNKTYRRLAFHPHMKRKYHIQTFQGIYHYILFAFSLNLLNVRKHQVLEYFFRSYLR